MRSVLDVLSLKCLQDKQLEIYTWQSYMQDHNPLLRTLGGHVCFRIQNFSSDRKVEWCMYHLLYSHSSRSWGSIYRQTLNFLQQNFWLISPSKTNKTIDIL